MTTLTRTDIVNLALREIGAPRIESWDDDDPSAIIARDLWNQAVRSTLSRHPWQFAMTAHECARSTVTPVVRYDYAYQLPTDLVRLDAVADNENMSPVLDEIDGYVVRDGFLLSNAERIWIEYVYDAPAIGTWPPQFVSVVSIELASLLASPLKSTVERERIEKLVEQRMRTAISTDSIQQAAQRRNPGFWRAAARGAWKD